MDSNITLRRRMNRRPVAIAMLGAMGLLSGDTVAAIEPDQIKPRVSRYNRSKYRPHVGKKQLRKIAAKNNNSTYTTAR
jgi:hypothetical protein